MKYPVTIDVYRQPSDDHVYVFVCGYALGKESCTSSIAQRIARELGQAKIPVNTFAPIGIPVKSMLPV